MCMIQLHGAVFYHLVPGLFITTQIQLKYLILLPVNGKAMKEIWILTSKMEVEIPECSVND